MRFEQRGQNAASTRLRRQVRTCSVCDGRPDSVRLIWPANERRPAADCIGFPAEHWRDATAYAALRSCARSRFAWEWLRRTPVYRKAWSENASAMASTFGLCRLEDPALGAAARPIWRKDVLEDVLVASAVTARCDDPFDLRTVAHLATLSFSDDVEHLLLSDGRRELRVDITRGTLTNGPVDLRWSLSGSCHLGPTLDALSAFAGLARQRSMPRMQTISRAARWAMVLRAHDAVAVGASQHDLAKMLYGHLVSPKRWRIETPEARSRVQRLVSQAKVMISGGWREFLRSHRPTSAEGGAGYPCSREMWLGEKRTPLLHISRISPNSCDAALE